MTTKILTMDPARRRAAQQATGNAGMKMGWFVILRSLDGEDGWEPVRPEDIPEWVKESATMARLIDGEMCHDPEKGQFWYRAENTSCPS